jgi:N utilization substance protein B|tara:strand:- start:130693 stop:131169 length:477 start_codon:yes stop_codon:yes gene_type:complete
MSSEQNKKPEGVKGSKKARASAARLAAVQSIYAIDVGKLSAAQVIDDVLVNRKGQMLEDEEMVTPDGVLYQKIVNGVQQQRATLLEVSAPCCPRLTAGSLEPLLASIILAGCYELLAHEEVDAPIVINEYINVTHAFYAGQEAKMVNGVLDGLAKVLR